MLCSASHNSIYWKQRLLIINNYTVNDEYFLDTRVQKLSVSMTFKSNCNAEALNAYPRSGPTHALLQAYTIRLYIPGLFYSVLLETHIYSPPDIRCTTIVTCGIWRQKRCCLEPSYHSWQTDIYALLICQQTEFFLFPFSTALRSKIQLYVTLDAM